MKLFKFIAPVLLSTLLIECGGNTKVAKEGSDLNAEKTECASSCDDGEKSECCSEDKKASADKIDCKDDTGCSEESKAKNAKGDCSKTCSDAEKEA